ncbi:hypothetical protein [Chengkuizengella marina]|uniref:Uncharacterized protein n=1 Tax=Chengkuizengella marina TaxID=2507566 RepID=A0A6N9Q5W4_9BACL|nr:hypothetical protein [Chengkuizengella marina]NBI30217.1 hypothetical protein [Chengkuizengella marina]
MKKLKTMFLSIFSLVAIVILTLGIFILIERIQDKLFVPQEYLMWIFKYPTSRLVFMYLLYVFAVFYYIFQKKFKRILPTEAYSSKDSFLKKHRKLIFSIFIVLNIPLFYIIVTAVTVITNNKIIDYSFLSPKGREYNYNDIVMIKTGVYGERLYLPLTHSKGDFFYIIELKDGLKIDLSEVGGVKSEEHEYFIIEDLDRQFVNMNIPKVSSMENFDYSTEHLAEIYTDKIRNILENNN